MTKLVFTVPVLTLAFVLAGPRPARAHCDTLDGPVVAAARAALAAADLTPVLKWIPAASEPAIRAAFARTLKVRGTSADARSLADTWFFETVVRVHRAAEGEPYTGLKPAGTPVDPAVAAADAAHDRGSGEQLVQQLTAEIAAGIQQRFARAAEARRSADTSVSAGREYVAAYVDLMHYLERLDQAASPSPAH